MKTNNKLRQDEKGQWWFYPGKGNRTRAILSTCKQCSKQHFTRRKQTFCSHRCRADYYTGLPKKKRDAKSCENCGVEFVPYRSTIKCCSKICANKLGNSKRGSPGPKNGNWKGGKKSHSAGYVMKWVSGRGHLLEHRVVMEQILGRKLESFEEVHHKNGIRNDNRPENLELWAKRQPGGQRVSDLIEYAKWVLETYEPIEQLVRIAQ